MLRPKTILLLLCIAPLYVRCICYFPNGNTADDNFPCTDDERHSACCGRGVVCLSGGLCEMPEGSSNQDPYVRGSCTDRTWRSSSCPSFCIENSRGTGAGIKICPGPNADGVMRLYCTTGEEDSGESQCDRGLALRFPANPESIMTVGRIETQTAEASSASTSTSSDSSSRSETSTSVTGQTRSNESSENPNTSSTSIAIPSESTEANNSEDKGKLAIGLGVGLGVGAASLLAGFAFWYWRRRRSSLGESRPFGLHTRGPSSAHPQKSFIQPIYIGNDSQNA